MILCHKCSGLLTSGPKPLYSCECISGYVRGFEKPVNIDEALAEQIKTTKDNLALYRGQGRNENGQHITGMLARLEELTR